MKAPSPPRHLLGAGISAVLVLLGFAAYAWQAPVTFEAEARIAVTTPAGVGQLDPGAVARTLDTTVLDRALLERLARARGSTLGAAELRDLAASIWIEAEPDATFSITCRDRLAQRAADACNEIARIAVERAPGALNRAASVPAELNSAVRALAVLASAHPALTASAPSSAPSPEQQLQWAAGLEAVRAAHASKASLPAPLAPTARIEALAMPGTPVGLGSRQTFWIGAVLALCVGLVALIAQGRGAVVAQPYDEPLVRGDSERPSARPTPHAASPAPPSTPRSPVVEYPPPTPASSPPQPAVPTHQRATPLPAHRSQAVEDRPPPNTAATAPTSSEDSVMLPPRNAASMTSEPHVTVTYEATNLEARRRSGSIPVTRTTQMMGSQITSDQEGPASIAPLRVKTGSATTRYSFVSTPPPAGGDPVKPEDVGPDWSPGGELDPGPCAPLCREIFAFGVEHCFVVGVSSVRGVEREKSEFAGSLALALAATGHARVLLMESDLDAPAQHRLMNAEMPAGATLSRQLQARMTRQGPDHWRVLRCTKSLHVLVDGPENTPGLILSRTFEECVRAMRAYYDFILLDGPPGSRESECRALDGVIDGLIVVCTEDRRTEIAGVSRLFTSKRFSKAIRANR